MKQLNTLNMSIIRNALFLVNAFFLFSIGINAQNADNVYFVNQYSFYSDMEGRSVFESSQGEIIQIGNVTSGTAKQGLAHKVGANNLSNQLKFSQLDKTYSEGTFWGADSLLLIGFDKTTSNYEAVYLNEQFDTIWTKDFGYYDNLSTPSNLGKPTLLNNQNIAVVNVGPLLAEGFTYTSINKTGQVLFNKTYSYPNGGTFAGTRVEITDAINIQNDLLITGHKFKQVGGQYDLFLARFDVNGDTLWTKSVDNSTLWGYQVPVAYEIEALSNGNYLIVLQDKVLSIPKGFLEIDANGSFVGSTITTIPNVRYIKDMDIDPIDGSIYISSIEEDANSKKFVRILKFNNGKNLIWTKDFYSAYDEKEIYELDIQSNAIILSGTEYLSNGNTRPFLTKIDTSGNILSGCNLQAEAGHTQTIGCFTQTAFLGANPTAYGATGSYSYNWSPANQVNNANSANPTTSTPGLYFVTVTSGSCQVVDSVLISGNAIPLTADAGTDITDRKPNFDRREPNGIRRISAILLQLVKHRKFEYQQP
jgi:hypothetical protein